MGTYVKHFYVASPGTASSPLPLFALLSTGAGVASSTMSTGAACCDADASSTTATSAAATPTGDTTDRGGSSPSAVGGNGSMLRVTDGGRTTAAAAISPSTGTDDNAAGVTAASGDGSNCCCGLLPRGLRVGAGRVAARLDRTGGKPPDDDNEVVPRGGIDLGLAGDAARVVFDDKTDLESSGSCSASAIGAGVRAPPPGGVDGADDCGTLLALVAALTAAGLLLSILSLRNDPRSTIIGPSIEPPRACPRRSPLEVNGRSPGTGLPPRNGVPGAGVTARESPGGIGVAPPDVFTPPPSAVVDAAAGVPGVGVPVRDGIADSGSRFTAVDVVPAAAAAAPPGSGRKIDLFLNRAAAFFYNTDHQIIMLTIKHHSQKETMKYITAS
jgi:hypothetical protein